MIILQDCLKLKKHCQAGNIINAKEKNIYIYVYVYAKFQYTNFHNYFTPNRELKWINMGLFAYHMQNEIIHQYFTSTWHSKWVHLVFTAFNWDLINILHTIKTSTNDAVYTSGNHFQLCLKFSNLTLTSKENRSKFCGNVNKPANANVSFMNF